MTLEQWMAANCGYLEMAIKDVPAKADLPPTFAALKDDTPVVFGLDLTQFDKEVAVNLFRAGIRAIDADQYAIIAPAWYVKLSHEEAAAATAVIGREGTGGVYKDQRHECYQVTVGDRERSLIAVFDVERDWKGKIRRLIPRSGVGAVPEGSFGRMVDLLVDRTMH
jgi:hypothetical protein